MNIRYSWPARTEDDAEVTHIDVMADYVPRKGEGVHIRMQINKELHINNPKGWCIKSGRVKDVIWEVNRRYPCVTVYLK